MQILQKLRQVSHSLRDTLAQPAKVEPHVDLDRKLQILLRLQYQQLSRSGAPLPALSEIEFSSYAQNAEDGILLFLFSIIETTNKRSIEIGAGNGVECNSANLIINHGWDALLMDGDQANIRNGKAFYNRRTGAWRLRRLPPTLVQAWISAENVNDLIANNGFAGEVDLLSIDIDGMDYWILKAISNVSPRVLVVEFNNRWGANQAVTVPYATEFVGSDVNTDGGGYFGASLQAFVNLGKSLGYRLIGVNGPATNAFFMRDDVGIEHFPSISAESCLTKDYALHQVRTKGPALRDKTLVVV